MSTQRTRSPLLLLSLTALSVAACSGGGGSAGEIRTTVSSFQHVVFSRDNSTGGSDLYRAPIDDSARPVNLTRHQGDAIASVWPHLVDGRIVYTAGRGAVVDFFSVPKDAPPGSGPGYTKLTTQSIGIPDARDWDVVGSRVVLLATVNQIDRLVAFAVDGREFVQLTEFADGDIEWPRDEDAHRNAVTAAGGVVFEHTDLTGRTSVWFVKPDGSGRRELSTADDAEVQVDMFGRPMIHGDVVVVREHRAGTTSFRAIDTRTNDEGVPLADSLAQHQLVDRTFFLDGRFAFEVIDTGTTNHIHNLYSIPLTGTAGGNGIPVPDNLTNFNVDGSRIGDIRIVPGTDRIVFAAELPGAAPNTVQADVLGVRLDAPGVTLQLTRPVPPVPVDDILDLTVCGGFVLFQRRSQPDTVWQARLDQAASDADALPSQGGNHAFLDHRVQRTPGIDPITRVRDVDPENDHTDSVVIGVTNRAGLPSPAYTNFFLFEPKAGLPTVVQLTAQRNVADGPERPRVRLVKGRHIVYLRSGSLFAADLTRADSEIAVLNSAMTIGRLFDHAAQGADGQALLEANGQLFVTRVDRAATTPGSLLQLTSLVPGNEGIVEMHFNTDARAVFTIQGLGRSKIVSARLDTDLAPIADISEAIYGDDLFRMAY